MVLYHLSEKYLGKSPILTPRIPECASSDEIKVPRICVATSVVGCYYGLQYDWVLCAACKEFHGKRGFHVYQVETDLHVKAHKSVADRNRSGERWLLVPHQFEHVCKMPKITARGYPSRSERTMDRLFREAVQWAFFHARESKETELNKGVLNVL
jgi:hypothetical protein